MLNAIEIFAQGLVGRGIDWNERLFHGYTTEAGITYNAYLIMDEKITLIDTCKATFSNELVQRISRLSTPPRSTWSSPTMSRWTTPAPCP